MRNRKRTTKSFTLFSEKEKDWIWSVRTTLVQNGSFDCRGCFGFVNPREAYLRRKKDKYFERVEVKERLRKNNQKFDRSERGKRKNREKRRRYRKTEKGRKATNEGNRRYSHSIKGRIADRKHKNKRRGLGWIPLNDYFSNSVAHHIDNDHIVYVPKRIHESFGGLSRKEHRKRMLEWIKENDKELWIIVSKSQNLNMQT